MAGKHRSKTGANYTARVEIRMPESLKAHLSDLALINHHSLNEEIVEKLMRPSYKRYTREMWQKLMALEPDPDDTRTDYEIALQIAMVKGERLPEETDKDNFEDIKINWLPGSEGVLYNEET